MFIRRPCHCELSNARRCSCDEKSAHRARPEAIGCRLFERRIFNWNSESGSSLLLSVLNRWNSPPISDRSPIYVYCSVSLKIFNWFAFERLLAYQKYSRKIAIFPVFPVCAEWVSKGCFVWSLKIGEKQPLKISKTFPISNFWTRTTIAMLLGLWPVESLILKANDYHRENERLRSQQSIVPQIAVDPAVK